MLGQRKKLDVGKAHGGDEGYECVDVFGVGQQLALIGATPRAQVHFVDRDGCVPAVSFASLGHPLVVGPLVVQVCEYRRGARGGLCLKGHRVGLFDDRSARTRDEVLVLAALTNAGNESIPYAARSDRSKRLARMSPPVEVADEADGLRVGCPHRKAGPANSVDVCEPAAESVPESGVIASIEKELVIRVEPGSWIGGVQFRHHCEVR